MKRRILSLCLALMMVVVSFNPPFLIAGHATSALADSNLPPGVQNIVKRAYQMTDIQWTPQQDILGWGGEVTYYAGVTYTGLPYGQPVYASYVPWSTDLEGFIAAVDDSSSKMYTSYSTYNQRAPYYSIDCSAFVSWAWGLNSRQTTRTISNFATQISTSSYENAEVGDCLNLAGSHVVLITDITYDSSGTINGIEISESTVAYATNYCCQKTRYGAGGTYTLDQLVSKYFGNGYILYRCNTRDSVNYTHSCLVPLEGDTCDQCVSQDVMNSSTAFGIDVSHHQGTIDWDTVASQIDFAILRCGFGDDLTDQDDRQWTANADACTRLGIPFGVYIYSYALTDAQALSEAEHVLRLIEGYDPTLPVYLDLEDDSILESCSNDDILRHATIFCNRIEEAGYNVGVYANHNWWTNYLTSSEYDQWDRWIARYADAPGYAKEYSMWQYSSTGSISGISGNVDLNYWYGDFPADEHQHSYTSYVSQEPTCTAAGTMTYTCSGCGNSYTETIAANGHDYQSTVTQPTCTAEGSTQYTCSLCGDSYAVTIPKLEHDYNSVTVEPSCETEGYTRHACIVCGDSYRDSIKGATGHLYENGICTSCGATDPGIMKGDLNGDDEITSADAVMLARYLVDALDLTQAQKHAADVNGDGEITSADSVILARYLVTSS